MNSLLLGTATVAGIAIKGTIDEGSDGNIAFFGVVVAVHFGILTGLALLLGYGGGMISSRPTVPLNERWAWFVHGYNVLNTPEINSQVLL